MPNPRVMWIAVTAAGAVLGLFYALSPVSLWFAGVAALLIAWSGVGLEGRERRAVVGVIAFSVIVRALVVALFFLSSRHFDQSFNVMIGDERQILWRAEWLKNIALGVPLAPTDYAFAFQSYGNSGMPYVFAVVYVAMGNAPYGAHLLNVVLAMAGCIVLHKLLRRTYGKAPAFATLLLLVFVPTLFVWSVSALKESAFFFLVAVALALIVAAVEGRYWLVRPFAAVAAVAAMRGVGEIRPIGWQICLAGFAAGIAGRVVMKRGWLAVPVVALAIAVAGYAVRRADVQAQLLTQFKIAAVTQIGNVETEGYSFKLLDPIFYTRWIPANSVEFMDIEMAARYGLRAFGSFFAVPMPWQAVSRSAIAFLPQQVLAYVAVVLALVGIGAGLRRDAWLTWLLTGYCVLGATIVSLPSGNIGTFIRMRDMIMPFVFCLSGLGAAVAVEFAARRLSRHKIVVLPNREDEETHAIAR